MKVVTTLFITLLAAANIAVAQSPTPSPTVTPEITTTVTDENQNVGIPASRPNVAISPSVQPYVRPNADKRFKKYIGSMFGPWSIGRAVASAGLSTWTKSPEEWGTHWDGFGKRFASNMGRSVMKNTMMYGMDEAFKLDSYYYRSTKKDIGSKIKNAMLSPVVARRPDGKKVFGFPRVVSTYASSVIVSETWYPDTDWKDGLRNGSMTLLFNGGYNLLKEFIWKK